MEWSLVVAIWTLFHLWATAWMEQTRPLAKYFVVVGESVVAGFALTTLNTADNKSLIIAYAAIHATAIIVLHDRMVTEYCLLAVAGTLVASVAAFNSGLSFLFGAGLVHAFLNAWWGVGVANGRI